MRKLPKRMSPVRDPVTMWTRDEVLERYQLRKDKEWKKMGLNKRGKSDCHRRCYPWTPAIAVSGSEAIGALAHTQREALNYGTLTLSAFMKAISNIVIIIPVPNFSFGYLRSASSIFYFLILTN